MITGSILKNQKSWNWRFCQQNWIISSVIHGISALSRIFLWSSFDMPHLFISSIYSTELPTTYHHLAGDWKRCFLTRTGNAKSVKPEDTWKWKSAKNLIFVCFWGKIVVCWALLNVFWFGKFWNFWAVFCQNACKTLFLPKWFEKSVIQHVRVKL